MKSLDVIVNKESHVVSWQKDYGHKERASREVMAIKRFAVLDKKGFEKVKRYLDEFDLKKQL